METADIFKCGTKKGSLLPRHSKNGLHLVKSTKETYSQMPLELVAQATIDYNHVCSNDYN